MKTFSLLRKLLAACALLAASHASAAVVLQVNGSGILTGAKGVVVNNVTYDVTFEDGTCASVFGTCAASSFTFKNYTAATMANQALMNQVLTGTFDREPTKVFGCTYWMHCETVIPYSTTAQNFSASEFINYSDASGYEMYEDFINNTYQQSHNLASSNGTHLTFAVFRLPGASISVPEPGSLALFGIALFGFAAARRRTR